MTRYGPNGEYTLHGMYSLKRGRVLLDKDDDFMVIVKCLLATYPTNVSQEAERLFRQQWKILYDKSLEIWVQDAKRTISQPDKCEWTFSLVAEIDEIQARRLGSKVLRSRDALPRMLLRGFVFDFADHLPRTIQQAIKREKDDQRLFMLTLTSS